MVYPLVDGLTNKKSNKFKVGKANKNKYHIDASKFLHLRGQESNKL